jgi:hypothetical protein
MEYNEFVDLGGSMMFGSIKLLESLHDFHPTGMTIDKEGNIEIIDLMAFSDQDAVMSFRSSINEMTDVAMIISTMNVRKIALDTGTPVDDKNYEALVLSGKSKGRMIVLSSEIIRSEIGSVIGISKPNIIDTTMNESIWFDGLLEEGVIN